MDIWEIIYLNYGERYEFYGWSSHLYTQLEQLWNQSLKKNSGLNGIQTHDLCDTGAEVMGSNPVQALIFFQAFYSQLLKLWITAMINHKIHIQDLGTS